MHCPYYFDCLARIFKQFANKTLELSIFIFLIVPCFTFAQLESLVYNAPVKWQYYNGGIIKGIDTINFDSININNTEYIRKSIQGDLIEEVKIDNCNEYVACSDEGIHLSGEYTSYYKNNVIKEIGTVLCNTKIKEWVYFHDDGSLKKYENFLFSTEIYLGRPIQARTGHYAEYYRNGNLKITGSYKLVEKYQEYEVYNPDLFKSQIVCCAWLLESIKDGYWYEFDINGSIISKTNHSLDLIQDKKYREISEYLRLEYKNGYR
jgi:antitoxin component YwqK of YwqJK toxin-antitoxin module